MLSANLVKRKAKEMGFDLVGITSASPMSELAELLKTRQREGLEPEFVSAQIEDRLDPQRFLPGAKSIVMVGLNYFYPDLEEKSLMRNLARGAWGLDYHLVLGEGLEKLGQYLSGIDLGLKYRVFVDTGPLIERELARRAGLGWIGKNGLLITPEFGSWIFLGGLAINRKLEEDAPLDKDCGTCKQCLKVCPPGALQEDHRINPHRCLSYLTQKKGYLTLEERSLLGNRLYGCDACQEICPINKGVAKETTTNAFKPGDHVLLPLKDIINFSKKEFKELFGPTAVAWRGKNNLKRNAVIALGNSNEPGGISLLLQALKDPSSMIRGHAAWALGYHGGEEALNALTEALAKEKDSQAYKEIVRALEKLFIDLPG